MKPHDFTQAYTPERVRSETFRFVAGLVAMIGMAGALGGLLVYGFSL